MCSFITVCSFGTVIKTEIYSHITNLFLFYINRSFKGEKNLIKFMEPFMDDILVITFHKVNKHLVCLIYNLFFH